MNTAFAESRTDQGSENLNGTSPGAKHTSGQKNSMLEDEFYERLLAQVQVDYIKIVGAKEPKAQFLSYPEVTFLADSLRQRTRSYLGHVPSEIEAGCNAAEAMLAPTHRQRVIKLRALIACFGTGGALYSFFVGIVAINSLEVGALMGAWHWLFGVSLATGTAWIAGGAAIAVLAGYFTVVLHNPHLASQKALQFLRRGINRSKLESGRGGEGAKKEV